MSNEDRGLAYLIAGFGLGTLVGTLIGLLVAPKSGRELRADLAEYSKDTVDKAKDLGRQAYEKGRDQARVAYESGRQKAREFTSRVGEKLGEVKEQLTEAVHKTPSQDDAPTEG